MIVAPVCNARINERCVALVRVESRRRRRRAVRPGRAPRSLSWNKTRRQSRSWRLTSDVGYAEDPARVRVDHVDPSRHRVDDAQSCSAASSSRGSGSCIGRSCRGSCLGLRFDCHLLRSREAVAVEGERHAASSLPQVTSPTRCLPSATFSPWDYSRIKSIGLHHIVGAISQPCYAHQQPPLPPPTQFP